MIEVKSKFDQSITTPLIRLQVRKVWWLFVILPVLFVLLGVLMLVAPEPDLFLGIFLISVGVLFLPLVYFLSKAMQNKVNGTMKIMSEETTNYFRFDENGFYQETVKNNGFKGTTEMSYAMLFKAYETKSNFFIYISNMQTHVVPKKDIVSGTSEELANILSANLGKKFKVLNLK